MKADLKKIEKLRSLKDEITFRELELIKAKTDFNLGIASLLRDSGYTVAGYSICLECGAIHASGKKHKCDDDS